MLYDRASVGRRGIVMKILKNNFFIVLFPTYRIYYVMFVLLHYLLRRTREAQTGCQILSTSPSAIVSGMSPHFFNDFIRFANSLGSDCECRNMERIFSALPLPAVVSKSECRTEKEATRNSVADRVSS